MFCTRCGTQLEETVRFCNNCGAPTVNAPAGSPGGGASRRLVRSVADQKVAGVCAGFAHYFGVDVTLMRILWIVLVIWPVPLVGLIAYFIAWIVMPIDTSPAQVVTPTTV